MAYAVVLVPIANSPIGSVPWWNSTFSNIYFLFSSSVSKFVQLYSVMIPSRKTRVRLWYSSSLRNTFATWSVPSVPSSFGEVKTSPSGILTSARQFSKRVSFEIS